MKGISIREPYGSLITHGFKSIETRSEKSPAALTKYRGELLICLSFQLHKHYINLQKSPTKFSGNWMFDQSFDLFEQRQIGGYEPKNFGHAIGLVELVDIRPLEEKDAFEACTNYFPNGSALIFENPRVLKPFPIKGLTNGFHLGIFDVNIEPENLEILWF